jgi:hypothetical protein
LGISVRSRQNSPYFRNLPGQDSRCGKSSSACAIMPSLSTVATLLGVCMFLFFQAAPVHAQDHKSKVPIVGKLSSGNRQSAYSGKVQSVDMKQRILNVNALEGPNTEIFPFKKNVRIENLNGGRMNLSALTPGTAVLIYFDQKSGERTIKNIVVLSSGKEQAKGKPAPSS